MSKCCDKFSRGFLLVVNLIFSVTGLGLVALGLYCHFGARRDIQAVLSLVQIHHDCAVIGWAPYYTYIHSYAIKTL